MAGGGSLQACDGIGIRRAAAHYAVLVRWETADICRLQVLLRPSFRSAVTSARQLRPWPQSRRPGSNPQPSPPPLRVLHTQKPPFTFFILPDSVSGSIESVVPKLGVDACLSESRHCLASCVIESQRAACLHTWSSESRSRLTPRMCKQVTRISRHHHEPCARPDAFQDTRGSLR
jgi:hypothetical protein